MTSMPSTCLFCSAPTRLLNDVETIEELEDRSKRIKNLCFRLHLSSAAITIPDYCSNVMFPLCGAHEDFLEELWEQQQIIDKATQEVSRKVLDFETTLAHYSYFWGRNEASSSSTTTTTAVGEVNVGGDSDVEGVEPEPTKFHKLRDMIIEGYFKKLMAKKQPWLNLSKTTTSELRVVSRDSQVFAGSDSSSESEVEAEVAESEIFVNTENRGLDLHLDARKLEVEIPEEKDNDDDDVNASSPLLISDIRGTNVCNVGGNEQVDRRDVKSNIRVIEGEELVELVKVEAEVETDLNSECPDDIADDDDNETPTSDKTARIGRFHFENIEIFRYRDSNGIDYLECSVCNRRFPKPRFTPKGRIAKCMKLKLKTHLQTKHKPVRIPNNRKRKSARVKSDCQLCKKNFELCLLHKKKPTLGTITSRL
ncbi:unnamed protein product [Orchesella dallaii]|uniref:Zinc finger protein n=1 Tax=Orchesella dallaii TaxID=48710 RepID=A0ABP1RWU4_9HEXA